MILLQQYGYKQQRKKSRIKFTYILTIIILTLIISFSLYMVNANSPNKKVSGTSISNQTSSSSESSQTAQTSETTPPEPEIVNPVPESAALDVSYFAQCAFVGDSISQGLSAYQLTPELNENNVLAGKGMNLDKINTATITTTAGDVMILDALKTLSPKNVYIMLGSNGIAWLTNEKMIKEYSEFIDKIKAELPDAKIYVLSIPPVTAEKETDTDGAILNSAIDSYNSELLKMANEKKIYFVDINTALKGNDGKLPSDKSSGDGMHLNKAAYQTFINYILTHTVKD